MNCLLKKGPYKTDKSHIYPEKRGDNYVNIQGRIRFFVYCPSPVTAIYL